MHYAGLLVLTRPDTLADCVRELATLPGMDVYASDPTTGRIVVVLETQTVADQEAGLRRAQALPFVLSAELVVHHFGDAAPETPRPNIDSDN